VIRWSDGVVVRCRGGGRGSEVIRWRGGKVAW